MQIGIDFGTTHTTAAYYDGQQLRFIPLDSANKDVHLLRSMLYITKEQQTIFGVEAAQTYLRDNSGRAARLEQKYVGTIQNTVARLSRSPVEPDGPITYIQDVYVEEDVGAPGRLIQSVKTGLRDAGYYGTHIYGRFYTLQELIAEILTHTRKMSEAYLGASLTDVVLGRPVMFAGTPEEDALAEQRLREAAELAGFREVTFVLEPVAAALFYTLSLETPKTLLVFDFGGGTLDLTVMRAQKRPLHGQWWPEILATQGVLVGGDDFDSAIMREKVAPYFGTGSTINGRGQPFPAHLADKLYRWQTIPALSKATHLPLIRRAQLHGNNPQAFAALETLVLKNYGFALFERIEQSKRLLSEATQARLEMQAEAIDLSMVLSRKEFQTFIAGEIARVHQGIDDILQKAGVKATDIDVVVMTGGSSLIPVFQKLVRQRFTAAEMAYSNTFGSAAGGLALYAHHQAALRLGD